MTDSNDAEDYFSESQRDTAPAAEVAVPSGTPAPPTAEAPATGGQADDVGDTTQASEVFDVSQYADREVVVKVNGEDVKVPLSEALAGYQRQADYTRKTQKLSQAEALQSALEANPQATLELLSKTYGAPSPSSVGPQSQPVEDDWSNDDPVAQQLQGVMGELQELRSYQMNQILDSTLSGLSVKYGDDFNEDEVLKAAASRNIQSPAELEGVYRDLMFDKFYAEAKAREDHGTSTAAEDAAREAALLAAAAQVSQGNGIAPSSSAPPQVQYDSFEAAYAAAAAETGF